MKIKARTIRSVGIGIAIILVMCQGAVGLAYTIDRTVGVSGTATKLITPGPLLDNFDSGQIFNLWGCPTSVYSSQSPATANAICTASYIANPSIAYGGTGESLQLTYNVSLAGSYAGYSSQLGSQSLSGYKTVSFWIKGVAGGEFFKVELKASGTNANTNSAKAYINNFLDGGVTTAWKYVTIPLSNFANISEWSSMKEFVITFENAQSAQNGSPTQSTIYIDNITFGTAAVPALRVAPYGDKTGMDALGGNMGGGSGSGGASSYSFSSSQYYGYPNGLQFNYDVSNSNSYVFVYHIFGGGADGNQLIPKDVSAYNNLTFDIMGASGGNPGGIKVELHDTRTTPNGQPFYVISNTGSSPVTTGWKHYTVPLSSFQDWTGVVLNKSYVTELVFTIENGNASNKSGTVYIDNVQFE